MVKKINNDAITIKSLLEKGYTQYKISKMLNISKQKVHYWARTEIKSIQTRKKKFRNFYINKIINLAKNKTTSQMSSKKIAAILNSVFAKRKELDKNGKPLSIHFNTICNYLREFYGKPRKIRKAFYLSKEQMIKRVDFCRMILARNLDPQCIFFTDECKIDLSPYTKDSIRLEPETKTKLKSGDLSVYNLINRQQKKFEKSLVIAGGISFYGVGKLVFLDGTMNDFAYGQTLMFYKDDIDSIREKYNKILIIEQDGATCHKSKRNTKLLNSLFGEDGWIQNPPNSPDLAYPIEDLWAIIKPRVKRREPSSIDELKKFLLEEWYSIPLNLIQNLCKNYLYRINKVIELNGARLEPEHLKKEKHDGYKWEKIEEIPRVCMAYNEKQLGLKKAKEISKYKKEIKLIKRDYNKKKRNLPKYKKK